jgi:uncharacterized membrane protein
MKKAIIFIAAIVLWGLITRSTSAEIALPEVINSFDVNIKINSDASFSVSEKIQYDFSNLQKHGIFRNIPVKYKARGGNFNLRISEISVQDENGQPYNFTVSPLGNDMEIKIGNAEQFVTGQKIYVIGYTIRRALNFFTDHDEFYWNMTGDKWPVVIKKASLKISLPQNVKNELLKSECFIGVLGSAEKCLGNLENSGGIFSASREISLGEGMTVVFGFPKGVVHEPSFIEKFLETLKDNWVLFLPPSVLFFMLWLWRKKGKDPLGRGTIIAQFDAPDNLTPFEVGTIIDEKADKKDISAEIISLAVRGYLKIKKTEKKVLFFNSTDYVLEKLKNAETLENDFDQKLMEALLGSKDSVAISDLKDVFHKSLKEIENKIYESVFAKGYFIKNPEKVRHIYLAVGIMILVGGIFIGSFWEMLGVVSWLISGIIVIIFSFFMPKKTKKGAETREYILGLKDYLMVAEKDRIKFHNAPEKNPEHFEKLLPYAMVLGVEKEWAEQFKDIYKQNPSWYEDKIGSPTVINAVILANNLDSFSSSASANLYPAPSSASSGESGFSGGGSGGGFGGGGGGSW